MKKYFITSDIHSYYKPFTKALKKAHFNKNNPEHILIICGDLFDRGPDTVKLYKWIKSLPKERRILIRGNHEYLLLDVLAKNYFDYYDYSNGTYNTFCHLNKNGLLIKVKDWINSDEWVNFYELNNYIFVHSFIPLDLEYKQNAKHYYSEWRSKASHHDWVAATWGCPWEKFRDGFFDDEIKNNKILVCGHWHTSDFYNNLDNIKYDIENNPIYLSKNLIGLDACTALTKGINILTVENDEIKCYNYNEGE